MFDRLAADPTADPAVRYYFLNRCGFGGRVNYALPSRLRFTNAEGWNVVAGDALERAAALLNDVRVTCGDFAPLLDEPGSDVWAYCDPPYLVNDALPPSCRLYRHAFTEADHRRFAAAAGASPHRVAVSYGDDPAGFARSLFPGWRVAELELNYGGTTGARAAGRELLFLNTTPCGLWSRSPIRGRRLSRDKWGGCRHQRDAWR
ncbi:modification methylase : D12 class N6 adenine-specific DNA methyltransferase OS=Caldicellulosiruptor hydrothermalis (strain DSM 18901 / VKM B-2411 / 108) GN=Calhy_0409 PE=4 SV=1: MethyltransfD12 [Gemmataceae bacterium]|nr:modification methylase : D12 class N6 adenine-specific DNA methyltransferase OS=Caldicellulosiruptor hydrothermalis (strain DSM 18901 / VKM B-2411 / 108) GN=Calhy_0409 PE=4 SV=1: MethyltransfD12 [Gemmataceae bacterium]VTT97607.1 modification methylase : D12 class N6 adenine-specific DNA methyltransferase OS=Caldicellulosiruptor hydrothermalis (strain DSM 18901 / VKM B-2411 / 108) GN=Calhy_0409 PE=4 SV=1: MethyltransfD12 [Gemmataceae bacterium]